MPTLTCLSAADLRKAVLRFRDALRAHQEELNRLNVYPVPDGDTGTNMALTLESVSSALRTADSMDEVCHAVSRGSLMGARGNSGVITSQILRGLVEGFGGLDAVGAVDLRRRPFAGPPRHLRLRLPAGSPLRGSGVLRNTNVGSFPAPECGSVEIHAFGPLEGTFRADFHGWGRLKLPGRMNAEYDSERPARLH